jgi:hypothetical protein
MVAARTPTSLDKLLDPILTPEFSLRVVDLRPDEELQSRLQQLRDRANEGTLTDEDRAEYEEFIETLDLLALLKLRAKAVLDRNSQ